MRALACLVALLLAACATSDTANSAKSSATGVAGPLTWEISDIGRVVSADNQRVRWSYLITLRNTSDRVIQVQRMERATDTGPVESWGGTPSSQAFRRTIGARGELRVPTSESWGWASRANTAFGGAATLHAIRVYRTFIGTDDRGAAVRVQVRLQLDPSTGTLARPPVAPASLPAPNVLSSADGLASLVGLWRGSYRVDDTLLDIPVSATIVADGTISLSENEPVTNRFSRKVQVKDGGLEYSGDRERGTLRLHELTGRRMLVGRITPIEGRSYAVYLEAQAPASAAAPPVPTAGPPVSPTPVSAPSGGAAALVDLSGSYRGTVTGTRTDNSTYSARVTVAMVQVGRELSGTWSTPSASGTLMGTVLDRTRFTFRLRQDSPCPAELSGLGAIDDGGARLAASYRGASCQGTGVAASIVITRESR